MYNSSYDEPSNNPQLFQGFNRPLLQATVTHLWHTKIQQKDLKLCRSVLSHDVQTLLARIQDCRFTANTVQQTLCDNPVYWVVIHNHDLKNTNK
jgi:hypothetical protein